MKSGSGQAHPNCSLSDDRLVGFAREEGFTEASAASLKDLLERIVRKVKLPIRQAPTTDWIGHPSCFHEIGENIIDASQVLFLKRFLAILASLMVIGFFWFQTFKEDHLDLEGILPLSSYATTVRSRASRTSRPRWCVPGMW